MAVEDRGRDRLRLVAVGFAAMVVGVPRLLHAAEPYVLSYEAPKGCPDQEKVRRDVADQVGDLAHAGEARVALRITMGTRGGFAGELVATDRDGLEGRRAIDGKTCAEVAQALAFLAALAIELGGRFDREPALAEQTPSPRPPAAATVPAPSRPHPARSQPTRPPSLDWTSIVVGQLRGGLSNVATPAGELGFGVGSARVGAWTPSIRASLLVGGGGIREGDSRVMTWLTSGRLEVCPLRLGRSRLEYRPCLAGELGSLSVHATSSAASSRSSNLWAAVEAGVRLRWVGGPSFFLELGVGTLLPLTRERHQMFINGIAYTVPGLTARGALAAGLRF
jgi:hypothetical protein